MVELGAGAIDSTEAHFSYWSVGVCVLMIDRIEKYVRDMSLVHRERMAHVYYC